MILFVTTHGLGWRTTDGTNWVATLGIGGAFGVVYHPQTDRFVAWGNTFTLFTSPDALTWTATPSQPGPGWVVNSLVYAPELGLWLAAVNERFSAQQVSTSPDLAVWSPPVTLNATGSADGDFPGNVAWSGSRFVFIGSQLVGATPFPIAMWSPDAVTWHTASVPPGFGTGSDVCWSATHGLFVAVGRLGNPVATSPDGDVWTTIPVAALAAGNTVTLTDGYTVAENNGTVVVGGKVSSPVLNDAAGFITSDLSNWQWTNPGGQPSGGIFGLAPTRFLFAGGRWWAGTFADINSGQPQVASSTSGLNNDVSGVCWTPRYGGFFLVDINSHVTGIAFKQGNVPTRQYPRDDHLALGAARQGSGRSSSVQGSIRQGSRGTYQ